MPETDIMKVVEDLAAEAEKKPLIPEIERQDTQGSWIASSVLRRASLSAPSTFVKRRPSVSRSLEARVQRMEAVLGNVQKMVAGLHRAQGRGKAAQRSRSVCHVVATVTVDITKEGDLYLSQAREIDVSSFGESEEEAIDMIREACELYFEPPSGQMPEFRVDRVEVVVGD